MIKFLENSDKKLKFVAYPLSLFVAYFVALFLFTPLLYWCLYLSPIYSSLTCQRTFLARINCQLKEKSALHPCGMMFTEEWCQNEDSEGEVLSMLEASVRI